MFQENVDAINSANKANSISSGEYEAIISAVNRLEARSAGKHPQLVIRWGIAEGEYEGAEYPQFLTLSPNAAGVRAGFYAAIGYVIPEGATEIDENDFIGLTGLVTVDENNGSPRVIRVRKSQHEASQGLDDSNAGL